MSGLLALERLLVQGRAPIAAVARRRGEEIDFAAFSAQVASWAAGFCASPGQRFALYFDDSFDFACALFGAWHAGKIVVLPADTLVHTLEALGTEVDGWVGDFPGIAPAVTPLSPARVKFAPLDPQSKALVIFTSGSTGAPTAIRKRLSQLFDEVTALEVAFGHRLGDSVVWGTVSHQHIYGLLARVLWPLAAGRVFSAKRLAYPEAIVAAIGSNCGPAVLIASPAHLKRMPGALDWPAVRSPLRAVFSSGGPLPDAALDDCRGLLGMAPIEIFGSSETGGVAWRQRTDGAHSTVPWRPLPGVELRITGERLELRSPHLASSDWEASADRVQGVGDGFYLLGRADRIVKVEEKRVSLTALESALLATGWLGEVRALVLPGAGRNLGVLGVPNANGYAVLMREGKRGLLQRLRPAIAATVEASAAPRRFRFTWALPVNSQGKTTAAALIDLFDPRRPEARLIERSALKARLALPVAADSPYFDGHFPLAPILPGVVMIEWALRFGRELLPLPRAFQRLDALKFQRVITPAMTVELDLDFNPAAGRLSFSFHSAAGSHASGRLILADGA